MTDLALHVSHGPRQTVEVGSIARFLDGLVGSDDPAAVFSALARLSVPTFSESCEVIDDADAAPGMTANPDRSKTPGLPPPMREQHHCNLVTTRFARSPLDPGPDYRGVVVHRMPGRPATPVDVANARTIVDLAVSTITGTRLTNQLRKAQQEVEQLHIALVHSREIGPAIGILMVNNKVTRDAAFDLLRMTSQHRNRKLHDIAIDVVETGALEPLVPRT